MSSEAPQSADLSEATSHSPAPGAGEDGPHEHSGDGAAKDFGPNEWLVDELYQRYLADPGSVDMAWWNFFADYSPPAGSGAARAAEQQRRSTASAPSPGTSTSTSTS
ncbi:MAG: 2-oxoglutarate dehydrogenase E1 subunit family protein, partial [Streptosporangiaceae bacterium]